MDDDNNKSSEVEQKMTAFQAELQERLDEIGEISLDDVAAEIGRFQGSFGAFAQGSVEFQRTIYRAVDNISRQILEGRTLQLIQTALLALILWRVW
jgi:hypothetical protein